MVESRNGPPVAETEHSKGAKVESGKGCRGKQQIMDKKLGGHLGEIGARTPGTHPTK